MGQPLLLTDSRDALAQKPPSSPRWARDLLVEHGGAPGMGDFGHDDGMAKRRQFHASLDAARCGAPPLAPTTMATQRRSSPLQVKLAATQGGEAAGLGMGTLPAACSVAVSFAEGE